MSPARHRRPGLVPSCSREGLLRFCLPTDDVWPNASSVPMPQLRRIAHCPPSIAVQNAPCSLIRPVWDMTEGAPRLQPIPSKENDNELGSGRVAVEADGGQGQVEMGQAHG